MQPKLNFLPHRWRRITRQQETNRTLNSSQWELIKRSSSIFNIYLGRQRSSVCCCWSFRTINSFWNRQNLWSCLHSDSQSCWPDWGSPLVTPSLDTIESDRQTDRQEERQTAGETDRQGGRESRVKWGTPESEVWEGREEDGHETETTDKRDSNSGKIFFLSYQDLFCVTRISN